MTFEFAARRVPEVHFGAGRAGALADDAAALGDPHKPVVLIADAALIELGVAGRLLAGLEAAGASCATFGEIAGEPKQAQVEAATDFVRRHGAGLVICAGGGSALDTGKVAATIARTGDGPAAFAMDGKPLPQRGVPKLCLPTTAGTGSEFSSTNIFTSAEGRKVWVWGSATKPDRVILDPELTVSLPPYLTAWTGLDAFAHALESCTNIHRHAWNDLYAHRALALIADALPTAIHEPANLAARGDMLLGAAYAGIAIDNCSAGFAHNLSHALAALGAVHHGLATALGLEIVLGWQAATDQGPYAAAATALGIAPAALPEWYSAFLSRCGVERRLPACFQGLQGAALAAEMRAPETQYMRDSSARPVEDADIDRFAAAMIALADGVAA